MQESIRRDRAARLGAETARGAAGIRPPASQALTPGATPATPSADEHARDVWCDGCERTVPKVSTEFGGAHGPRVDNWRTARAEVDQLLVRAPPRVSLIATQGDAGPGSKVLDKLRLGMGSPGHLLISYTLPSGEQKVMNISGAFLFAMQEFRKSGKDLVTFFAPEEYLFDTHNWWDGNAQGGVYNTRMVEVRLEQDSTLVTPEQVQALHETYEELQRAFERRDKTFALLVNRFLNLADKLNLLPPPEAYPVPADVAADPAHAAASEDAPQVDQRFGNCGLWTTGPANEVGIMDKRSMWPRLGLAYFYEYAQANDPANVNVVRWEKVDHAKQTFARDRSGLVAPHRWLRSIKYRGDMRNQTDVVAQVPEGSRTVVPELTEKGRVRMETRELVEKLRALKAENPHIFRWE